MTKVVVTVNNVEKVIQGKHILSDVSFTINQGDCLALIGPNGAGKTTLMTMLVGDSKVSKGDVHILEQVVGHPSLKHQIAILAQENVLPKKVKVKELIAFHRQLFSQPLSQEEIDALLGWDETISNQLTEKLSGGQRRLLAFVLTLIGRPKVLFLDEPTAGMDTSTRQKFWIMIQTLKEKGVTIIYSSHYIEEVEHTADRILVLHKGKVMRDTTPFAMRHEKKEKVFTLPGRYASYLPDDLIYDRQEKEDSLTFVTTKADQVWKILASVSCPIDDIEMTNRTLLNRIFETTKEESHENL